MLPSRLDFMEYSDEQGLALARAVRRRSLAEEYVFLRRLEEMSTLRNAIEDLKSESGQILHNRAQQVLAIARAARETLLAEEKLAAERIVEAELRLKVSREEAEAVQSKRQMAELQVGNLMNAMDSQGLLSVSPVSMEYLDPSRSKSHQTTLQSRTRQSRFPQPWLSDDTEPKSDYSDFESYYDAESGRASN
jgi:hypothetical protein